MLWEKHSKDINKLLGKLPTMTKKYKEDFWKNSRAPLALLRDFDSLKERQEGLADRYKHFLGLVNKLDCPAQLGTIVERLEELVTQAEALNPSFLEDVVNDLVDYNLPKIFSPAPTLSVQEDTYLEKSAKKWRERECIRYSENIKEDTRRKKQLAKEELAREEFPRAKQKAVVTWRSDSWSYGEARSEPGYFEKELPVIGVSRNGKYLWVVGDTLPNRGGAIGDSLSYGIVYRVASIICAINVDNVYDYQPCAENDLKTKK